MRINSRSQRIGSSGNGANNNARCRNVGQSIVDRGGCGGSPGTFAAEAAVKIPGCAELSAWGKELAPNATTPINPTPSRFNIPPRLPRRASSRTSGLPAVDWTADDVAAAVKATGDCANAAKKARNKDDITALTALWRGFGGLRQRSARLRPARRSSTKGLQVLLDDHRRARPSTRLIVVASARDGAEGLNQRAAAALKESTLRLNKSTSVHSHAIRDQHLWRPTDQVVGARFRSSTHVSPPFASG